MNIANAGAADRADTRRAFTLVELLVVIAIISVLIALLMPSLGEVRERARIVQCQSQLRNMGVAFFSFAQDRSGQMPDNRWYRWWGRETPGGAWSAIPQISHYMGFNQDYDVGRVHIGRAVRCPAWPSEWWDLSHQVSPYNRYSYSYNADWYGGANNHAPPEKLTSNGKSLSQTTDPGRTIVVLDGVGTTFWGNNPNRARAIGDYFLARHGKYEPTGSFTANAPGQVSNILLADGAVHFWRFGSDPLRTERDVLYYSHVVKRASAHYGR